VHEYLLFKGIRTFHSAVKAESYAGIGRRRKPAIGPMDAVLGAVDRNSRVLVVDDIFDTGCTMKRVRAILERKTRQVRIATLYFKPGSNRTDLEPDYYVRKTAEWIVFPHELVGLTMAEIRGKDAFLHRLLTGPVKGRKRGWK
jgi:hypoxanthine phosphoribosyltransferase